MSQRDTDRPNILLITTDQQRYDTLQALGNPAIFTPHLNFLAAQGVSFTHCYTDSPMCIPARQTIMTGRHGATNRQALGPECERVSMHDLATLPGLLTTAGYQTRAVGKMHFHPPRAHYGFEHMELLEDYYREREKHDGHPRPMDHGLGQNEMSPGFATVDESRSLTRWTVDRSVDFLETRDDTRPFFLWTSFAKPHPPLDCDPKYWRLYDDIDLPEPVFGDWSQTVEDLPPGIAAPSWSISQADHLSPQQLRAAKRAYYACITQIDYNLGYLFARLRELEMLDNTWIIFTSDHGEMLGDHHLGAKFVPLEASARVPMIVRPPAAPWTRHPLQSTRSDALVCLADLLPTCANLAGVDLPRDIALDGIDLLEANEGRSGRDRLFISYNYAYGLVEGGYKYIYTARDNAELLFNLAADPHEQRELIRAGAAGDVHLRMRAAMIEWLERHVPEVTRHGELVGHGEPPTRRDEQSGGAWPGFHSRRERADVLH